MIPDSTWLHRLSAGWKLAALGVAGTGLLLAATLPVLGGALAAVALLGAAARLPARLLLAQLRPAAPILAVLFAAQALAEGWEAAASVVLRLAVLILLAGLVTQTTTASAMTAAFETGLRPLARFGWRPRAIALALSLAIRFLPLLADRAAQVREAQRARGVERHLLALAVPLIVGSLAMAHDLAEAIEARGFDPDEG